MAVNYLNMTLGQIIDMSRCDSSECIHPEHACSGYGFVLRAYRDSNVLLDPEFKLFITKLYILRRNAISTLSIFFVDRGDYDLIWLVTLNGKPIPITDECIGSMAAIVNLY